MAMSFGKENPIEQEANNEPSSTLLDSEIGDLVYEMEDNSSKEKQSPESNVTPCFHSMTPSESPEKVLKWSWQETPPEERLLAVNMHADLNDSFCEQRKKLDLLEEQRKHLYEERQRSAVLVPYKFDQGNVTLLSDKYESVNLPWQLWHFRAGEAVIMTVLYEENSRLDRDVVDLQRTYLAQQAEQQHPCMLEQNIT